MKFSHLDLNLLRVFDAVMAERNLTRAARRLSLSQPAVSNALKRLRETVGEELLTRVAYGVKPTPRAEALWPEVRAALDRLQAAFEPSSFDPRSQAATFRLAMTDAVAALLLPPLVLEIERLQALADIRVVPLASRDPRLLLERDEADMAIGNFPQAIAALAAQGEAAGMRRQHLYASGHVCVMRVGHPLADQPLTLDAFCAAQHLMVSLSGRAHGQIDQALAARQRTRRVVLTVNQYFTAVRVVAHTDLLTVLPVSFVDLTGYRSQLIERTLPVAVGRVQVEALWHLRRDADGGHRWLREQVSQAAQLARTEVAA